MPKINIEVPDQWGLGKKEAVDALVSLALKEDHRKYGGWMRELANIVHGYYDPSIKGSWQALWTISTRAFSFGYRGHDLDATISALTPVAQEFNISGSVDIDKLITESWELGARYGEKRAKRPKQPK